MVDSTAFKREKPVDALRRERRGYLINSEREVAWFPGIE